ncbi:MAG TPA: hypothetical protein VFI01_04230 [Gaiellaceae bacterium]|nr:hypothetical protein [Gaiellaceae bacterium]
MAVKTQEKVRSAVARVGEELTEKAWTVGRDRKAERKKRLAWGALQGTFGVLATIAARRVGVKLWGVLTGERPPLPR